MYIFLMQYYHFKDIIQILSLMLTEGKGQVHAHGVHYYIRHFESQNTRENVKLG